MTSRIGRILTATALGIVGGGVGVLVAGDVDANVGPFRTTFSTSLSLHGDSEVELAPLGALSLRTHDGPLALDVRVDRIEVPRARELLEDPAALERLESDVVSDARSGVVRLCLRTLLAACIGGAALALLRRPNWRTGALGAGAAASVVLISGAAAFATFRPTAFYEPRYTGLLTLAPQAVGDVRNVGSKFSEYRDQLNGVVDNLSRLYETAESSPGSIDADTIRVLHVSDLHLNPAGFDLVAQMVRQFRPEAIIDTGDINDWGTTFESAFVDRISTLAVPYVFVRGNHDSMATQLAVAAEPNAVVLDGTGADVAGLRVWGIGDPRFTADKAVYDDKEREREDAENFASVVLERYRATGLQTAADIAVVHDPTTAGDLGGVAPLILAGHVHRSEQRELGTTPLLIEGSTGAAGLRGVAETGASVPLECSILYFDRTSHRLRAYDSVRVAGLGQSGAQIERHIIQVPTEPDGETSTSTSTSPAAPAAP